MMYTQTPEGIRVGGKRDRHAAMRDIEDGVPPKIVQKQSYSIIYMYNEQWHSWIQVIYINHKNPSIIRMRMNVMILNEKFIIIIRTVM